MGKKSIKTFRKISWFKILITVLILVIGLVFGIKMVQQSQENRSNAAANITDLVTCNRTTDYNKDKVINSIDYLFCLKQKIIPRVITPTIEPKNCKNIGGICQRTNVKCNGTYLSGYCPGTPNDIKCCVPTVSKPTPKLPGLGQTCGNVGKCINTRTVLPAGASCDMNGGTNNGKILTGLCSGDNLIRCCVPSTISPTVKPTATPTCTSYTVGLWTSCLNGTGPQTRIVTGVPAGCSGGVTKPATSQLCRPTATPTPSSGVSCWYSSDSSKKWQSGEKLCLASNNTCVVCSNGTIISSTGCSPQCENKDPNQDQILKCENAYSMWGCSCLDKNGITWNHGAFWCENGNLNKCVVGKISTMSCGSAGCNLNTKTCNTSN